MPSHPCPHCVAKFTSTKTLNTHIQYNHLFTSPAASAPVPKGYLATVKASKEEQAANEDGGELVAGVPSSQEGRRVVGPYAPTTDMGPYALTADVSLWDEGYAAPPAEMAGMMGSFAVTMAGSSTTAAAVAAGEAKQGSTNPSGQKAEVEGVKGGFPTPAPKPTRVKTFTVLFEATSKRMKVPHNEQYEEFLGRMRKASVPVADKYISGRMTGFTKDDGTWRYVLVDKKGGRGAEKGLGSTLFYWAMVSELVKARTGWAYVEVFHEKQKGDVVMSGNEQAAAQTQTGTSRQHAAQSANVPGPTPAALARQAVSIMHRVTEFSTTRYLVQWLDGPSTWVLATELGEENQWMIDAYQSELDRGTH